MKYIGLFKSIKNKNTFTGKVNGDLVTPIESIFYHGRTGRDVSLSEVEVLCPVNPSKIVCIGKNYKAHAEEFDSKIPEEPLIFLKASNALNKTNSDIKYPSISAHVDYEGEIALVIGKEVSNVTEQRALDYVLGFTCANDITARDLQRKDGQWSRGKSFNGFCPIGPWILLKENIDDYKKLKISTKLNGLEVQSGEASQMIFSIPFLISHISKAMTLYPGDVVLTGTPSGVNCLKRGDEITIEIEQVGKLVNKIV